MMSTVLRIEGLKKVYPNGTEALRGLSFQVNRGEIVAIIGASGSGKSTLLRCLNRLVNATSGEIFIDNQEISSLRGQELRSIRKNVGMIFQHYNLVQRLSVLQNVLHGRLGAMSTFAGVLSLYSELDKQKAVNLLRDLGLENHLYHRAGDLSGGQKQRVGIARALMQEPSILLCDEPISSLDPSSAKTIMDLIVSMAQERNLACLVNLHHVDVALRYGTRIIGVKEGQIVYDGPPAGLTHQMLELIYNAPYEQLIFDSQEAAVV